MPENLKNTPSLLRDNNYQVQLSLFFAAIFLTIGCYLPYFPLWLKHRELSAEQIGFVIGVPMMVRILFTPLFSLWADFLGDFRKLLVVLSIFSMIGFLILQTMQGFWPIFIVVLLGAMFWTTLLPLTETMAMIAGASRKLHYGRARAVGSASFVLASFGFGFLVDFYGPDVVVILLVLTSVFVIIAAFNLPNINEGGDTRRELTPPGSFWVGVSGLINKPLFWVFLLGSGLGQGCHAFYYGFASVHWQSLGYSGALVGSLWSLGVIAEIMLFVWLGDWLRRFNPVLLLLIGAGASVIRFGVMAFDPPLLLLFPLQTLHALSFGIAHLGAIYFIGAAVSREISATAQGLYATVAAGVFLGGMVLASGPLYETMNASVYLLMSVMGFAAGGVLVFLYTRWDGRCFGEPVSSEPVLSN